MNNNNLMYKKCKQKKQKHTFKGWIRLLYPNKNRKYHKGCV